MALLGLGAGAATGGLAIPALMGAGGAASAATPALGPGLMAMSGAPTAAGVTAGPAAGIGAATAAGGIPPWALGAMAASPVASALLGRSRQSPFPNASAISLGSKPQIQVPDVYANRPRVRPAFLARLLAGMR